MKQEIEALLEKTSKFCKQILPEYESDVKDLQETAQRKTFKICVAGGFSRGKSHFLNFLLGTQLLPESALPTTTRITSIMYGERPELCVIRKGREEKLPLTSENLAKFSGLSAEESENVELRVYCPWQLLEDGLVLVDTPGVDDGQSEGAKLTCQALLDADAAIVMLSAISPLSLTEKEFIRIYLLDRSIPLMACGVSYLDQVPLNERANQLEYLIKKTGNVYPDIKFLVPNLEDGKTGEKNVVYGRTAIEDFLKKWHNLPRLQSLRERMVLERLKEILGAMLGSLSGQKKMLEGDIASVKEEISTALESLESGSETANELKMEFTERIHNLMENVRAKLQAFADDRLTVVENSGFSEEDFDKAFSAVYEEIIDSCMKNLQEDLAKLNTVLSERFNIPTDVSRLGNFAFTRIPVTKVQLRPAVPDQVNLFIDKAVKRVFELGDLLAPRLPLGSMAWPMLKPQIRNGIDGLRKILTSRLTDTAAVEKEINACISRTARALREQLEEIYQGFFEVARKTGETWLELQKKQIMQLHDSSTLEERHRQIGQWQLNCYSIRDEADNLLKMIGSSLS